MNKNIVIALDGTWNTAASETNIHWLSTWAENSDQQRVYYDEGVGTRGRLDETLGGKLGIGLSKNVCQAYRFLLEHYAPGDRVYIFGFSRGAFTARSLAGFIQLVGRLDAVDDIDDAYFYYRIHEPGEDDSFFERLFLPRSRGPIPIRFLGVFDTVGALGLPFDINSEYVDARETRGFWSGVSQRMWRWLDDLGDRVRRPIKGFHDTALGDLVEQACHALAIDEQRAFFAPTLWTRSPKMARTWADDGTLEPVPQQVVQTWFAGSHIDVGGGDIVTPRPERLSNVSLAWMLIKARAAGMLFPDPIVEEITTQSSALGPQHDSMTRNWLATHRTLGLEPITRSIDRHCPGTQVDDSVYERLGKTVAVKGEVDRQMTYAPKNLTGWTRQGTAL